MHNTIRTSFLPRWAVLFAVLCLLFGRNQAFSDTLMVSADYQAVSKDTILVPVLLKGFSGTDIYSVQFTLQISTPFVSLAGIQQSGTLTEGWAASFNSHIGSSNDIALSGISPVQENGVLCMLALMLYPGFCKDSTAVVHLGSVLFNEGHPSATAVAASIPGFNRAEIYIPDTSARAGSSILLPVMISDVADFGVYSAEFSLGYDSSQVSVDSVFKDPLSSVSGWEPVYNILGDSIRIAVAGSGPLNGAGILAYLRVNIRSGLSVGDTVVLSFSGAQLNEGDPVVFTHGCNIGIFEYMSAPVPQSIQGISLLQCYPNPFNPRTTIIFHLSGSQGGKTSLPVSVNIYDISGRLIRGLFSGFLNPGLHQFEWDGRNNLFSNIPACNYIVKVSSCKAIILSRAVLIR